ncbi:MAG: symmetrical bis(5'-nucleosyl)-tetraphosphatase [Candidatus Thioglobus sp.]|nr:MAG: symmetrical bis(5'-nucleosyl)-tetraphosphatase [Candidatus Thioglobus sp.]|tara:strand:- start:863 stop:1675 length:813 start_codon:yes stop_codon:yes gene_type:complete
MATYAIGDIQGCYQQLRQLLDKLAFDANQDRLWLVGDLVNRGPQSLQTLQYIRSLGSAVSCVLGNHDIHLIACHAGVKTCKPSSSLTQILRHPEADDIVTWLRHQPLLHFDQHLNWLMVHAGLLPQWDFALAQQCAQAVEAQLKSADYAEFLRDAYGDTPAQWQDNLSPQERLRISLNAFTRLRVCDQYGRMNFEFKGELGAQAEDLHAWFEVPRKSSQLRIVFGHWSALGLKRSKNILAIDTGCLWGQQLTAARLDTEPATIISLDCPH